VLRGGSLFENREQQSGQRALGHPQQEQPEQPCRLSGVVFMLEPSDEDGFAVFVPSLIPACVSEGDAREEELANIGEAI
jgi:hypothetical protein